MHGYLNTSLISLYELYLLLLETLFRTFHGENLFLRPLSAAIITVYGTYTLRHKINRWKIMTYPRIQTPPCENNMNV